MIMPHICGSPFSRFCLLSSFGFFYFILFLFFLFFLWIVRVRARSDFPLRSMLFLTFVLPFFYDFGFYCQSFSFPEMVFKNDDDDTLFSSL